MGVLGKGGLLASASTVMWCPFGGAAIAQAGPTLPVAAQLPKSISPVSPSSATLPSAAPSPAVPGIAEIVVTAQRREESLKNVPISVQAITGDQLSRSGTFDTKNLGESIPTLNYAEGSAGASGFALRGVQSIAQLSGIQPSTALVLDGVPVLRQNEFIQDLADIDRIEVLNGPQGTLFGKNSTAGVVNIVTKNPSNKFEGSLEAGATTDAEYLIRGIVNVPLSDSVEFRGAAFYRNQNPTVKNVFAGVPDIDGTRTYGFEGKLKFKLGERTSLLLSGSYGKITSSYAQYIPILPSSLPGFAQVLGLPLGRVTPRVNNDSPTIDRVRHWNVNAEINTEINDDISLVSISSYRNVSEDVIGDFDGLPTGGNIGSGLAPNPLNYQYLSYNPGFPRAPDSERYYSEEIRLNYNKGPIKAILGGFYQHARNTFTQYVPQVLGGSLVGASASQFFLSASPTDTLVHDETASVFGDVTLSLSDHIKIFGGARYTHETIDIDYARRDYLTPVGVGFDPVTGVISAAPIGGLAFYRKKAFNNVSGRAGIQWQPTHALNFYASYAHGYKGPGTAQSSNLSSADEAIVNPEIADSYEVGAKLRLFGNRLAIDTAAFYETIANIQESVVPPGTALVNQLINAGTLKTRGIESTFTFVPIKQITIDGGVVYDLADYHDFRYACNSVQTPGVGRCAADGTQNINGEQAVGAPKWKVTGNVTYANEFKFIPYNYYFKLGYVWVSSIQYNIGDDPLSREPAHALLNASLGLKSDNGRWELQLYARNLTNKLYYSSLFTAPVLSRSFGWLPRDWHRYVGLNLKYRF